jgi:hypothetical protein
MPTLPDYQSGALPLGYTDLTGPWRDSNPRLLWVALRGWDLRSGFRPESQHR